MPKETTFLVKIYDQDNSTLLKTLATGRPADGSMGLKNKPSFSSRINGGLGECVLDLATAFDSFGEGTTVDFLNLVDIWAVVRDLSTLAQTTTRVYKGYLSAYEPYLDGGEEGVRVT